MSELGEPKKAKGSDAEDWDSLTNLADELLLEILRRLLPDCRSVFRFTAVSKRCYSLVSTRYSELAGHYSVPYTLLFECIAAPRRKITNPTSKNKKISGDFCLKFLTYQIFSEESRSLHNISSSSSSSNNYLNFLPVRPKVRGSFEDLLLVSKSSPLTKSYYICNPLTRKYVALPRAFESTASKFGLVFRRDQERVEQNKYRVVLITYPVGYDNPLEFVAEIYCSKTREWRKLVVRSPKPFSRGVGVSATAKVVACNGILYWLDGSHFVRGIAAFDPFDDITEPKRCRYIDPPEEWMRFVCLGACEGRLRLSNIDLGWGSLNLRVWELIDGGDNRHSWCLKHNVRIARMKKLTYVLAFHPADGDVVFFFNDDSVFRCHLRLRKIRKVGEFTGQMACIQNPGSDVFVFPLVHPFWPTRVPSPPSI